jgi:hypothetical protein
VQAVINVKHEEDDIERSDGPARPSLPPALATDTKPKNDESQGYTEQNRRRLINRKGNALVSDDEEGSEGEENRGRMKKLRKTSRVNYREEDDGDDEEDELIIGAGLEVKSCFATCGPESEPAFCFQGDRDEFDDAYPIYQQAPVAPRPKKRRKYDGSS